MKSSVLTHDDMIEIISSDDEDVVIVDEGDNAKWQKFGVENFWVVVDSVLQTLKPGLFTEEVISLLGMTRALPLDCQDLFFRLLPRTPKWILRSKISVKSKCNITTDHVLTKLVSAGLLLSASAHLDNILHAAELLTSKQVAQFCRSAGIFPLESKSAKVFSTKTKLLAHLDKYCDKGSPRLIAKCLAIVAENAYSIPIDIRSSFLAVFYLFSLISDLASLSSNNSGDTAHLLVSAQLFGLIQVRRGEIKFPYYEVSDCRENFQLFETQEQLSTALWFHLKAESVRQVLESRGKSQLDVAIRYATEIEAEYRQKLVSTESHLMNFVTKSCPSFLWRCTLPSIGKHALETAAACFEKDGSHERAVSIYRLLLQTFPQFSASHRGKWWVRIALDLQRHVNGGSKAAALAALTEALQDQFINLSSRLELEERLFELTKKDAAVSPLLLNRLVLAKPFERTISATQLAYEFEGHRTAFSRSAEAGAFEKISVEEAALDYYIKNVGLTEGIHAEGSSLTTLMGLLFWDIIFGPAPSGEHPVFVTKFQTCPLDFLSGREFFERRRSSIMLRLDGIRSGSVNCVELVEASWNEINEGSRVTGVSWATFAGGLAQVIRLLRAFGSPPLNLCSLLEMLISDYRFYHSGFPDLTLWGNDQVKFVEVKGPGDSLSAKQRIWLDVLIKAGCSAEVCFVRGDNAKRLK